MYSIHVAGLIQRSKEAFENFVNSFRNNYYTENFNKLHAQKIAFLELQTANSNRRASLHWLNGQIQQKKIIIEESKDKSFQKKINNLTTHSFYTSNFLAVYKNYLNSKQQMLRNQQNFKRTAMFTTVMGITLAVLIITAPIIVVICMAAVTLVATLVTFKYAKAIISKPSEHLEEHIGKLPDGTKGNLAVLFNACRYKNTHNTALNIAIINMEKEEQNEKIKEYSFDNVTHLELIKFVENIHNNIIEFVKPFKVALSQKQQEIMNETRKDERAKYPQTILYDKLMKEQSFANYRDVKDLDEELPSPEPITINSNCEIVDSQWSYCSLNREN